MLRCVVNERSYIISDYNTEDNRGYKRAHKVAMMPIHLPIQSNSTNFGWFCAMARYREHGSIAPAATMLLSIGDMQHMSGSLGKTDKESLLDWFLLFVTVTGGNM